MKAFTITLAAITMMAAATVALAATDSKAKTASVRSPESIECSKQADAKGLHGAERKKFRAECKKELKAKAAATTPSAPPASSAPKTDTQAPAAKN
jgi:hypothetical protein